MYLYGLVKDIYRQICWHGNLHIMGQFLTTNQLLCLLSISVNMNRLMYALPCLVHAFQIWECTLLGKLTLIMTLQKIVICKSRVKYEHFLFPSICLLSTESRDYLVLIVKPICLSSPFKGLTLTAEWKQKPRRKPKICVAWKPVIWYLFMMSPLTAMNVQRC